MARESIKKGAAVMLAVILLSNTVTAYAADRGVEPDQVVPGCWTDGHIG